MRGIKTGLSAVFVIGLVSGSATVAIAQEDTGDPSAATWVTGSLTTPGTAGCTTATYVDGVGPDREQHQCAPQTWTTDDPRLSGTSTWTWTNDVYVLDEATVSVSAGTPDLRNDAGGWGCDYADQLFDGTGRRASPINENTLSCVGNGDYDGLTAILAIDWDKRPMQVYGFIFPGEAPPLPGPGAVE